MRQKGTPGELYARFAQLFHEALLAQGFGSPERSFPLAAQELKLLGFQPLLRVRSGRSYLVGLVRGDGLVSEQIRYLADQYFHALNRERSNLLGARTLLRGICVFVFEQRPDHRVVGFLMQQVRPRTPLAPIRSVPWILHLETGRLQRPLLTRAPFSPRLLQECARQAREATDSVRAVNGGP